ncbi:outer membrane protein assembly factor BamB family protein [Thermotoga profunda]|uniref:outer membrane protein assembly factor BamB family protein n=1 Tax=Thermotoga profunda TaxID=1508420 RepID=UPI00059702A6|nr:PQQ-binding-like beta-propeller repeat protein [Thermotoga profunda]
MKTIVLILSMLAVVTFGQYLLVASNSNLELYDISIPLVPLRTASTQISNPVKAVYQADTIYVLCQSQIESYDFSLKKINNVNLGEKAFDMLVSDNIYVFSEYKMSVYRKDLIFQRSYTFAEKVSTVDFYGNYVLILHSNGKVVCYTKTMNKVWELSGPDPFLGIQVVDNYLFSWTKSRFYMMGFNEGYPVYEKEGNFGGNFNQVIKIRDSLLLLDSNGILRLVPLQSFRIVDTLSVNAKSISSYGDYVYATTKDGSIRIVNVLFSTMKLLHSFSSNVVFSKTLSIATKPKPIEQEKIQSVETPKIEKKQFETIGEFKLPLSVKTSCVVWKKNVYSTTMTGELVNFNMDTKKTSSLKVSFITTSDPVLMKDGTVIMSSWDKSVYLIRDKIAKLKTNANISLPASITPQGFVVADDDGLLLHFDSDGNEIWRFSVGNWLVCSPVVHERFGILTLDWLGILRLTDFSGNLVWAVYLEFSNNGTIALSQKNAFVVNNEKLYAVDLLTGKVLWTFSPDNSLANYIVCNDRSVFCYDQSGVLYSLDHSGKVIWTKKFDELCSVILTESSRILVFTKKEIILLDRDSKTIDTQPITYPPTAHPVMSEDGTIYIISNDKLILYSVDDRPAEWAMYLKDQLHSSFLPLK